MRTKALAVTASLLLSAFVSFSMLNQVHAQSFKLTPTWAGYTFLGVDSFYNETVVAYESGSTAVLYVNVQNNYGALVNVSAVGISLNWGDTFESTQANETNPVTLKNGESRIFTITFAIPSTVIVSNLFRWDYEIYLEHVNATGVVYPRDVKTRENLGLPYFVVYSAEQAKSKQIAETIDRINRTLGISVEWNSTAAGIFWKKAMNETSVADYYYRLGLFSNAAKHYKKALSLINDAFSAEESKGTALDNAQVNALNAQVKVAEAWANFANGLSNMWTLIGIALVLFALGYIIRGLAILRRTQVP